MKATWMLRADISRLPNLPDVPIISVPSDMGRLHEAVIRQGEHEDGQSA